MTKSARGRGRRGGKGRGVGNAEAIRNNFVVSSSLNVNAPQRPTLDQASQPQAQATGIPETGHWTSLDLRNPETKGSTRGRGRRGGKGRVGNVEGVRDNFAVSSSLNVNPLQRPTLDQASQPQAQATGIPETSQRTSLDLRKPETKGSTRGGSRRGGKGRVGNVEGVRDNFAVSSSLNVNPLQRPTLDQASQPQAQATGIPETSQRTSLDLRKPETKGSTRGVSRRGGKGRGLGNVEGVRDKFAVSSSLNVNPLQRPTLDQASQPQAQATGIPETSQWTSLDLRKPETKGSTRGRGRRGGKGRGLGNVEGVRDNFAVSSSLNVNPLQRPTLDQASQPQSEATGIPETSEWTSLDLRSPGTTGSARGKGRRGGKGRRPGNVEGIRDNFAVASSLNSNRLQRPTLDQASQPQAQPTGIPETTQWTSLDLRSPERSQEPSSGSQVSRNLEGSEHPSSEKLNSGAVTCSNTKKGRGKYRSIHVDMRTKDGSKITVNIPDDIDRAVGPGARDIVNYCGLIMRSTISFRDGDWASIFAKYGQMMLLKVKEKFEVGGGRGEDVLQGFVICTMQRLFRTWKTRLHAEYSLYNTDEERLSHPPKDVMPEDWKFLVQYFGSQAFKAVSERNKMNRKKQTSKHSCGSKSFAEVEESTKNPLTGEKAPPDRVWELQHTRKNDKGELLWSDPQSQQIHSQIHELVAQKQCEQNENPMTGDEILATVLGERTGYVRGKGYGKKPLKKRHWQQADLGSGMSSAIESVREEMLADMDRRLQEEREQMRAEMEKRFQDQMEEERRQMRVEMDKRFQDQMVTLMVRMQQQGQCSSTAHVIQGKKQKTAEVSWGIKRKRR